MDAEGSVNVAVLSAGGSAGVIVIAVLIGGIIIFRYCDYMIRRHRQITSVLSFFLSLSLSLSHSNKLELEYLEKEEKR